MKTTIATLVFLLLALSGAAGTQTPLEEEPGYFPIETLQVFSPDLLKIDIDLKGPMLKLISAATQKEEPEFSTMIAALHRIRVNVGNVEGQEKAVIRARLANASDELKAAGWELIIRAREDDEDVSILVKQDEGVIQGLTVLVLDDEEEAVLLNIVGSLDPEQLGRLGEALDIDL